jgi:23S rRNA (uracil1939-C5)-methyltransferase
MTRRDPPQGRKRGARAAAAPSASSAPTRARVTIEKLVPGGHGLGKDDGAAVFVDGVAVGDVVDVDVVARGGARFGRLVQLVAASPDRVTPDCVHAGRCGGCDWLHLSRAAQTRGKEQIVDDALLRVARLPAAVVARVRRPLLVPPVGNGGDNGGNVDDIADVGARRRARFVVDDAGRLTFSARHSHARVAVDDCPALAAPLRAFLAAAPRLTPGTEVRVAVDDAGVAVGIDVHADRVRVAAVARAGVVDDVGAAVVVGEVTAGAFAARSDPFSFTQATRFGGAAIRDAVVAAVGDVAGRRVLELFAGAGHLTLPLMARGARVTAVEGDARALSYLRNNVGLVAVGGGVDGAGAGAGADVVHAFIDGDNVFDVAGAGGVDVVVADPPRTGLVNARALFARARSAGVARVVLVSCDVATGARDLAHAVAAGYVVDDVVPIDAFPRTHHVEWVARLSAGPQAGS